MKKNDGFSVPEEELGMLQYNKPYHNEADEDPQVFIL
jgi:hypothetical protein